jgi:hypothetical protein
MPTQKQLANLKPPKKGEVRNPNGRPKGTPNIKTVLRKWLETEQKGKNPFTNKEENMTQLDVIVLQQLVKARKGDTTAFNTLLDRYFGRAKQTLEVDVDHTTNGEPINESAIDLSKLTDAELRTLVKLERKARISKT